MVATVLLAVFPAKGAVQVNARLDSVNLLMGNVTMLYLEAVQDKGKPGGFTIFRNVDARQGYVGVCGDSVELRTSFSIDTVELGSNRIQLNYKVPVQAFDSGTFRLPEFVYVSESDSARSNALTLNVIPVKVTADDPIAGFARVADPENPSIFDKVPNWLADWWWLFLIIALAAAGGWWAYKRYKKEGTVLRKKPEPTPYETAIRQLKELKNKNLWEMGREKEYFTDLTDILRVYLDRRFGINAMEMTSREIMDHLYNSDVKDKRDYVRQILSVADFVKFAKVRPLPADNIAAYENALKFVEETKPEEKPEDTNPKENEGSSTKPKKKGGEK